jgi:hypothetical protein
LPTARRAAAAAITVMASCTKTPAPSPPAPGAGAGPVSLYVRMRVDLYRANAPEELAGVGEVEAGQEVKAVSTDGAWTEVEVEAGAGEEGTIKAWLPSWYLAASADNALVPIDPYFMFTKGPADLCLTPEPSAEVVGNLDPGRIVEVKAVSGDWAYVAIRVYDIPAVQRGWVLGAALGTREEVTPAEADLLAGTVVYYNDFSAPPGDSATSEVTTYDRSVLLRSQDGPWVWVSAAGGWDAWVKTADLHYPETGPGR